MNENNFLKEVVLDVIRELIEDGELNLSIDILPDSDYIEYGFGGVEKYNCFKILVHLTSKNNLLGYWESKFNSSVLRDILVGKGDTVLGKEEIEHCFRRVQNDLERGRSIESEIFANLEILKEKVENLENTISKND